MKRPLPAMLIVLALALPFASLSCRLTLPAAQAPQAGSVLFQDDFSDPRSGWERLAREGIVLDYIDGAYRMFFRSDAPGAIVAHPGLNFTDVQVETILQPAGEQPQAQFGLVCRYQDGQNFYFFLITPDGYYGIGKAQAGKMALLDSPGMPPSEAISRGASSNRLRAECTGDRLALTINGVRVAQVRDAEFSSGGAGMIAGVNGPGEVEVYFDQFSVLQP